MAVQDLTPQLRTRLSRLERLVGWFVTLATLLLLAGLAYYIYNVAERKGWFLTKAPYFTYLNTGAGIKVGDPVKLMGFDAGEITKIKPEKPESHENVYVEFILHSPNYGYVWDDSVVLVKSSGLLGARYLEVTKGGTRVLTNLHASYKEENAKLTGIFVREMGVFTNWHKGDSPYELYAQEPPELSSQLDEMLQTVKRALPNVFQLTNTLAKILTNAADAVVGAKDTLMNANDVLTTAKPAITNLSVILANLTNRNGSLGDWVLPTNVNQQLTLLLTNANTAVTNVNTNLVLVISNITVTLENLAGITSNLNAQVQSNGNIVTAVSTAIVHADEFIQGLKHHWLLRSAFKEKKKKEDEPPPKYTEPKGGRK